MLLDEVEMNTKDVGQLEVIAVVDMETGSD